MRSIALSKLLSKAPAPQAATPHAPAAAPAATPPVAAALLVMSRPKRVLEAGAEGFAKADDVDCDRDRDRDRDDLDRLEQRADGIGMAWSSRLDWTEYDRIPGLLGNTEYGSKESDMTDDMGRPLHYICRSVTY